MPEAEVLLPHDGLTIDGHMGGVGLRLVPHRHQSQVSVLIGETNELVSTKNAIAHLLVIVNHAAGSNDDWHRWEMLRANSRPSYCSWQYPAQESSPHSRKKGDGEESLI